MSWTQCIAKREKTTIHPQESVDANVHWALIKLIAEETKYFQENQDSRKVNYVISLHYMMTNLNYACDSGGKQLFFTVYGEL